MQRDIARERSVYPSGRDVTDRGRSGTGRKSASDLRRLGSALALAVILSALAYGWWLQVIDSGRDLWSVSQDDYSTLSLAHALNLEWWFRTGEHFSQPDILEVHPGLPFYFLSWVALRISGVGRPAGWDLVWETLISPDRYWLAQQALAFLLAAAGTVVFFIRARGRGLAAAIAASWIFYCVTFVTWHYGLTRLGNDSAALLFAAVFYLAACRSFTDQRSVYWLALGAVCALAYLSRLNYITWLLAALLGLAAMPFCGARIGTAFRGLGLCLLGFVGAFAAVAIPVLGWNGVGNLLTRHWQVLTHSGYYGGGDAGVVSWQSLIRSLNAVWTGTSLLHLLMLLTGVAVMGVGLKLKDREWRARSLPLGITCFAAAGIALAAALKHFHAHYLIAAAALLPALVLWLVEHVERRSAWLIAPVVVYAFIGVFGENRGWTEQFKENHAKLVADVAAVRSLPLENGQTRIWARNITAIPYAVGSVARLSSVRALGDRLDAELRPEISFEVARDRPDDDSWRYIVFPRHSRTMRIDEAPAGYLARYYSPESRVHYFDTLMVIERPSRFFDE